MPIENQDKLDTKQVPLSDIKVGDRIIGPEGKPVVVTHVFDSYVPKDMYELTMENGEKVKCSGNHLWYSETSSDRENIHSYLKLVKYFFKHCEIPDYDKLLPAYPYSIIGSKFSDNKKCQDLIKRACLSLGPTYQTPNVIFDGLDYVKEVKVYAYSFNDLIDFLKGLKKVLNKDPNQYFYFGQVRETKIIADIGTSDEINLPLKGDILHANY